MVYFKYGDRVQIDSVKYGGAYRGATGTVKSFYGTNVAIAVDGHYNQRSDHGYYYFNASSLKHIKYEEDGGHIMEGNYLVAHMKFLDGTNDKTYLYACYNPAYDVGDICVVKTAHHGFGVATIEALSQKCEEKLTREIVCRVDFTEYKRREENRARKAELAKLMKERAAALQEIALYKMLSANDDAMADLVNEYEQLEEVM